MKTYIDKLHDIYSKFIDVNNKKDLIVTTPRRAGKTTLLRNVMAYLLDQEVNSKNDILFAAPQRHYQILTFRPNTTSNSIKELEPQYILVEEAAYCKFEVLETLDICKQNSNYIKTLYIGTPTSVKYTLTKDGKYLADNYLKRLIDEKEIEYIQLGFKDYPKEFQDFLITEKDSYTREQWRQEFLGEWI